MTGNTEMLKRSLLSRIALAMVPITGVFVATPAKADWKNTVKRGFTAIKNAAEALNRARGIAQAVDAVRSNQSVNQPRQQPRTVQQGWQRGANLAKIPNAVNTLAGRGGGYNDSAMTNFAGNLSVYSDSKNYASEVFARGGTKALAANLAEAERRQTVTFEIQNKTFRVQNYQTASRTPSATSRQQHQFRSGFQNPPSTERTSPFNSGRTVTRPSVSQTGLAQAQIARQRATATVLSGVSHIGSVTPSIMAPRPPVRTSPEPLGLTRQAAAQSSDWQLTRGEPGNLTGGSSFGPITSPSGQRIVALNNAGQALTAMRGEFVVPAGLGTFTFEALANFVTTEFPDFVGTEFNDDAVVRIITPGGRVGVYAARDLFRASVNGSRFAGVNGLPAPLAGFNPGNGGGQTGFSRLSTSANIAPGGRVTVEVLVANVGDRDFPSAVLLSPVRGNSTVGAR